MNYIILGGSNPDQKQWVDGLTDAIQPIAEQVSPLHYQHWAAETAEPINVGTEIDRLAELAKNYDKYAVIAKSLGATVTTLANARGRVRPERCFFLGFLKDPEQPNFSEFEDAIRKLPPTTFIQNSNDPTGRFMWLRKYILENSPERDDFDFKLTAGNTHEYKDFGLIARIVKEASS